MNSPDWDFDGARRISVAIGTAHRSGLHGSRPMTFPKKTILLGYSEGPSANIEIAASERNRPIADEGSASGAIEPFKLPMTTAKVLTDNFGFLLSGRDRYNWARRRGTLLPRRHQVKHLEFVVS